MLGAARLHADTYEEVEDDPRSLGQAGLLVLGAALSMGAATAILGARAQLDGTRLLFQVALTLLLPLVIWLGGSAFAYMMGASFFRTPETETDFAEVLRTTGFAFTPGLLGVLGALPPPTLGLGLNLAVWLWMLAAGVVAIRQALDFSTARALGSFGFAALLLWLIVWGLSVVPLPL